jgi:hypothetical protein
MSGIFIVSDFEGAKVRKSKVLCTFVPAFVGAHADKNVIKRLNQHGKQKSAKPDSL